MPSDTFGADPLEIKEQLGRIAMQPSIQAQHEAQARYLQSRATVSERQAQVQQQMSEELQRMSANEDAGEYSNPLWRIAAAGAKVGHPDTYKMGNAASLVDYRAQAQQTQKARAELIQRRTQINNLSLADHLLSGVTDDASLREAIINYEEQTGDKTPLLNEQGNLKVPYSSQLVQQLRMRSLSKKDELVLAHRKAELESADRERKSKQSARTFWQNFENQEKRSSAQAKGRQSKVSGDPLIPLERVIKAGADYIANTYDTDERDPESRVKGRQLMEMAAEMKKKNAAMSTEDAMSQALKVMQDRGDFVGKKLKPIPPKPGSAKALPPSGSTSDLKVNEYYTDGKETRQWLGPQKKWGPAVKATASSASADLSDEEDSTSSADDEEADRLALEDDED